MVEALRALAAPPGAITRFVHGTTVVTNLLLERTGARVVLCATANATDLLELRRQERASLYDLSVHHPATLVPPELVVAVPERRTPAGVAQALTTAAAAAVVRDALARGPDVVVIALLHAYEDPATERMLAEAFHAVQPDLTVVCATEVLPEIREYERTATAVAEGYARPGVARYLARLGARVREAGFPAPAVMTSGGGMRTAADAARHAASLALSGPSGGVVGAAAALRAVGRPDALTIDIGGTSADAGIILDGEALVESGGSVAGVPIALPRVLVETVSAGGGSIAWRDDGGALRVGPRSAGARPGPVAFAQGGTEPTVTDAQIVLGRIGGDGMSGGVRLQPRLAHEAVARLASTLGATAAATAEAIVRAADAEMARALRRVSVDRGADPRRCILVAFGGGGPLHACALADALAMPAVLVPPFAGVLSAVGLALAAERREEAMSLLLRTDDLDAPTFRAHCEALAARTSGAERTWIVRARYVGQGHEVEVRAAPGDAGAELAARFGAAHMSRYGFTLPRPVECVALRHVASDPGVRAEFARDSRAPSYDAVARVDVGGPAPDAAVRGPASVVLSDATLWIAVGWRARALPTGGWWLERESTT